MAGSYDLTKHTSVKHINGDLRALVLVQAGVKEIDQAQLKEAARVLKKRSQAQLVMVIAECNSNLETESESKEVRKSVESKEARKSVEEKEKRRSVEDKAGPSTSSNESKGQYYSQILLFDLYFL